MNPNGRPHFDGLLRPFREFLFPPLCFVCEELLSVGEHLVCASCLSRIRTVSERDSLYEETLAKLTSDRAIAGLVAAFYFETGGQLQSIVHQLKYSGMTSLGVFLGEQVGKRVEETLAGEKIAAIIPVPLHRSKKRERGYNQSEYICKGIASILGVRVEPGWVMRRVYTPSQTLLSIEERKRNVAGAFAVRPAAFRKLPKTTVLLVDDVVTTGATMQACARVLREAGAARVIAVAAALAT